MKEGSVKFPQGVHGIAREKDWCFLDGNDERETEGSRRRRSTKDDAVYGVFNDPPEEQEEDSPRMKKAKRCSLPFSLPCLTGLMDRV